ncbi:MAG: hypothetical protein HWE27_08205 [Gammaproteobacteria bacterium]|nr:hypothetical protein [Gammaproteobacteria bacterium]
MTLDVAEQDVVLESFEQSVYSLDYTRAFNELQTILHHHQKLDLIPLEREPAKDYFARVDSALDRFVAAAIAFLVNNHWVLTEELLERLLQYKQQLSYLIWRSSFANPDYVISLISNFQYSSEAEKVLRYQVFLSLESNPELIGAILSNTDILPHTLVQMTIEPGHKPEIHEPLRDKLIEIFSMKAQQAKISNELLKRVTYPWMNCSYLVSDLRHVIKMSLNRMIENRYETQYLLDAKSDGASDDKDASLKQINNKPTIMVMLEMFTTGHAMYRCHKTMIASLKQSFKVIFVAHRTAVDDDVITLCDEFYEVTNEVINGNLYTDLAKKLARKRPDMVFYPSIGMAPWSIVLANFRLAPVQCMGVGHPATSASKEIDFVLNGSINDPECFTEKVIVPKVIGTRYQKPNVNYSKKVNDDGICHIAIISSFMKINSFFLSVCQELNKQSSIQVKFHFFPHAQGIFKHYFKRHLEQYFDNFEIYNVMPYDEYMEKLSHCDIRLGTFPFGGTNSNIDCFALGIPYVVMDGPEAFSHIDVAMLERAGLATEQVANDLDEYFSKSLKLIEDLPYREEYSKKLVDVFNSNILFESPEQGESGVTNHTLLWTLQNAQVIQENDGKVFREGQAIE